MLLLLFSIFITQVVQCYRLGRINENLQPCMLPSVIVKNSTCSNGACRGSECGKEGTDEVDPPISGSGRRQFRHIARIST